MISIEPNKKTRKAGAPRAFSRFGHKYLKTMADGGRLGVVVSSAAVTSTDATPAFDAKTVG